MFKQFKGGSTTLERIEHLDLLGEAPVVEEPAAPAVAVMERAKDAITPIESSADLHGLNCKIERLSKEHRSLLGVEEQARGVLVNKLVELNREQHIAVAHEKFVGEKLLLSNEVLTWRKRGTLAAGIVRVPIPELALFGLDQSWTRISSEWSDSGKFDPGLPYSLQAMYRDVYEALGTAASAISNFAYRASYSLTAAFSGVIPAETKQKIRDAKRSGAFSEIRLLAEADWSLETHVEPFYSDPIVVGLVEDQMWVIDVFDPTPLEEYVAREFTT